MKEKAAPGDVRYCGEFCAGSAPLASLLPQAGPGYLRGHSLLNCSDLVCWSSCSGSRVAALPLPRSTPGLLVRCRDGEMAARRWPAPACTLHKGRTKVISLLPNGEVKWCFQTLG